MKRLTTQSCLPLLLIVLLLFTLMPTQVLAVPKGMGCLPDVGMKTPVLFVHGFHSSPSMWGNNTLPSSIFHQISKLPGIYTNLGAGRFNYVDHDSEWVNNPEIGPKLADQIDCMAQSSRSQGGQGKVIVVAHSMGGLAVRYAASQVADSIGLVVTIGTPNKGSHVADWAAALSRSICSLRISEYGPFPVESNPSCLLDPAVWAMQTVINSKVNQLPRLPQNIPVMAIAGNVFASLPFVLAIIPFHGSDLVVPVESASAGSNDPQHGGGLYVRSCTGGLPIPGYSKAPCEHNSLVNDPEVQTEVVKSIQRYLANLQPAPTPIPTATMKPSPTAAASPCMTKKQLTDVAAFINQDNPTLRQLAVINGPVCSGNIGIGITEETYAQTTPKTYRMFYKIILDSAGQPTQSIDPPPYTGEVSKTTAKACGLPTSLLATAQQWGACK